MDGQGGKSPAPNQPRDCMFLNALHRCDALKCGSLDSHHSYPHWLGEVSGLESSGAAPMRFIRLVAYVSAEIEPRDTVRGGDDPSRHDRPEGFTDVTGLDGI